MNNYGRRYAALHLRPTTRIPRILRARRDEPQTEATFVLLTIPIALPDGSITVASTISGGQRTSVNQQTRLDG